MSEDQRRELSSAMHRHEREVAELSVALARIDDATPCARHGQQQAVFLTAQMIKHRISLALLAARLGDEPPAFQ